MASRSAFLLFFILSLAAEKSLASVFSSRLTHRFSDEGRASIKSPVLFPEKRSFEYYRLLASIDLRRQRMNLGSKFQSLVPSEGSKTISSGNDFGWLHYTWIDIGTPSVSFLVALDSGSCNRVTEASCEKKMRHFGMVVREFATEYPTQLEEK